jgi:hypothetical protein
MHRMLKTYHMPLIHSTNALERAINPMIRLKIGGDLGMTPGHDRKQNSSSTIRRKKIRTKTMTYPDSTRLELSNKPRLEGIRRDLGEIDSIFLISGDANVSSCNSRSSGRKQIL